MKKIKIPNLKLNSVPIFDNSYFISPSLAAIPIKRRVFISTNITKLQKHLLGFLFVKIINKGEKPAFSQVPLVPDERRGRSVYRDA